MDHAESRSAGALWRATKLYVALRLHAEDTGPREQHAPSTARLSAWPVQEARKEARWAPKFVGWATTEREGWEGVLTLNPYLLRVGEGSGAVCLVARKSGHGEGDSAWSRVGIPSRPSRRQGGGYAERRMSCEAYRGVVYRQSFR